MSEIVVSLPDTVREFVESQAEEGGYVSASAYVEALIRQAQARQEQERLEKMLLDGLASGDPIEATPEYWDRKLQRLLESGRG
jgi:antitoxin ParD1/3/4